VQAVHTCALVRLFDCRLLDCLFALCESDCCWQAQQLVREARRLAVEITADSDLDPETVIQQLGGKQAGCIMKGKQRT
jgi:hypothetical protein